MNNDLDRMKEISEMYKKVQIGYVAVDSGQLILVDPCYLLDKDNKSNMTEDLYLNISDKTLHNKNSTGQFLPNDLGVAFGSGYGDGYYPVYALVKRGRPMYVWVEMDDLSIDEILEAIKLAEHIN